MNTITINGKSITAPSGCSVSMINGTLMVDGNIIELPEGKIVNIHIQGDVGKVSNDCGEIKITGNALDVNSVSGDINISGNVGMGVRSVSGDIEIGGDVGGDCNTVSGDITNI